MAAAGTPAAGSDAPPGRRERNKEAKRRRILAAARELFAAQGFAATTTAQIAERADVGAGTVFLYARSKEDLAVQVFRAELDAVRDAALASLPARLDVVDEILHLLAALVRYHDREPELARLFVKDLMFSERFDEVRAFVDSLTGFARERIEAAVARGELAPETPARELAGNAFALFIALNQAWLGRGDRVAEGANLARLRRAIAYQLEGFRVRRSPAA